MMAFKLTAENVLKGKEMTQEELDALPEHSGW